MRLIKLSEVVPGTVLAYTLYSGDGKVLLKEGATLTERIASRLVQAGYEQVFVQEEDEPDVTVEAPLSEKDQETFLATLNGIFTATLGKLPVAKTGPDQDALLQITTRMVDELATQRPLNLQVLQLRSKSNYVFSHSINVALLGIALGRKTGEITLSALVDLGMGLLLHDIGKGELPGDLIIPREKPTPEAQEKLMSHPRIGYDVLQAKWSSIKAYARIVALQHHERFDGKGYPKGLKGEEIHMFARICAIADTYDNLTSIAPDKPHLPPRQALEAIQSEAGRALDPRLVEYFMQVVFPYPVGSRVKLSTGEVALVKRISRESPLDPSLAVVMDALGNKIRPPRDMELREHQAVEILGEAT